MSDPKDDGGSAFPMAITGTTENCSPKGMSLRDYFAAGFAAQICAGTAARMVADRDQRYNEKNWKEVVAANAYEFADAMIKERRVNE